VPGDPWAMRDTPRVPGGFCGPGRSRCDPQFFFGYFFQLAEDGGCAVAGFAETTAYDRGEGTGGFPAAAAATTAASADRGLFARGFVFLTAGDRASIQACSLKYSLCL
jgi:hypothetical protein